MLSEMTKQAGCNLGERIKVAAAVVAMHNYDRTQDIIEVAGEMKKTAAHRGINLPDEVAIQAASESFQELDERKMAGASLDRLLVRLGRVPGQLAAAPWKLPAAGAALGAGTGALVDDEDRLRGALIGGGVGGMAGLAGSMGLKAREAKITGGKYRRLYGMTGDAKRRRLGRELSSDAAGRSGHLNNDLSNFYAKAEGAENFYPPVEGAAGPRGGPTLAEIRKVIRGADRNASTAPGSQIWS